MRLHNRVDKEKRRLEVFQIKRRTRRSVPYIRFTVPEGNATERRHKCGGLVWVFAGDTVCKFFVCAKCGADVKGV